MEHDPAQHDPAQHDPAQHDPAQHDPDERAASADGRGSWQAVRRRTISVVGEALVDLLIAPDGSVSAALGGAPFNTAGACARLGADVRFIGALSEDRFGRQLRHRLIADGVSVEFAPSVDVPTTLAAAELDDTGSASYRFYIEGTSAPQVVAADLEAMDSSHVRFTGGLGLVLEPMATAVEQAFTTPAALTVIDINCRPLVISDRTAYTQRALRVAACADIVKVSDDDLDYLFPGVEPLVAARSLLADEPVDAAPTPRAATSERTERATQVVLLTAGAAGVHLLTNVGERFVPAVAVEVSDTVGAGDTFGAGFLTAWVNGSASGAVADGAGVDGAGVEDAGDVAIELLRDFDDLDRLEAAVAFGARAAAVTVSRPGADPPWWHELAG